MSFLTNKTLIIIVILSAFKLFFSIDLIIPKQGKLDFTLLTSIKEILFINKV